MSTETLALKDQFAAIFGHGKTVHVVRAPGRVNLIGEHTDYNDGFVFPMAIEPHVLIAFAPRTDSLVRIASKEYPNAISEFSISTRPQSGEKGWSRYPMGMAAMLMDAGFTLKGMDALMTNTLPMGGGLSSSAALEIGTGRALLSLIHQEMEFQKLALLGQQVEHQFASVPCGIMDQTIVAGGRAGHAMLMDCRDLSKKYIPIDPQQLRVVIVNSMVHHELSDGGYEARRNQCYEGVRYFQSKDSAIKALRDVSMQQVLAAKDNLSDVVFRRCRHVVGEIARTTEAAQKLVERDFGRVGSLMIESHNSLRDDYQVSTRELDFLVEESRKIDGVYGVRMTGGGFGGCVVALVKPDRVTAMTEHLLKVFPPMVGGKTPDIFITTATDGAQVIE